MKMYCLTLKETPERWAEFQSRAEGLDIEPFYGIHGATFGLVPRLPVFDNPNHKMSAGRVGLFLSFLNLWRHCLTRPDDPVLIFEDDAVICAGFDQQLSWSMEKLPADWDVVSVGSCCTNDKPTEPINDRVAKIRYPLCNHAVLWRKDAIDFAIRQIKSCSSHLDITLAQTVYPHLNHYSFIPPLASQDIAKPSLTTTDYWPSIPGFFDFGRLYDEAIRRAGFGSVFVELGSWMGRSAAYMAEQIKVSLKHIDFYAIDTWKGTQDKPDHVRKVQELGGDMLPTWKANMVAAGVSDFVKPIQSVSWEAADLFPNQSVDFVFVDADHKFDAVVADIRAWRPKLKNRGVMAGHDIDRPDVVRAVRQEFGRGFRTWERCWIVDPK